MGIGIGQWYGMGIGIIHQINGKTSNDSTMKLVLAVHYLIPRRKQDPNRAWVRMQQDLNGFFIFHFLLFTTYIT